MKNEMIEHRVEIDDYVSATIKIPKILTAMELKALMVKANKLFNLAEVPLVDSKPKYKPISNSSNITNDDLDVLDRIHEHIEGLKGSNSRNLWTQEMDDYVDEKKKQGYTNQAIANQLGLTNKQLGHRLDYLTRFKKSKKATMFDKARNDDKAFIELHKTGMAITEIAKKLNRKPSSLYVRKCALKKSGRWYE